MRCRHEAIGAGSLPQRRGEGAEDAEKKTVAGLSNFRQGRPAAAIDVRAGAGKHAARASRPIPGNRRSPAPARTSMANAKRWTLPVLDSIRPKALLGALCASSAPPR